jgi:hypothetical protein
VLGVAVAGVVKVQGDVGVDAHREVVVQYIQRLK